MAVVPYFFGNFCINDGQSYLLQSKQLDPPALQYQVEVVGRTPGVKYSGARINERPITVVIRVVGTSRIDLENKVDALMQAMQYQAQRLQLHANDSRYFLASCVTPTYTLDAHAVIWVDITLVFVAFLPYAYAANTSTFTMASQALTSQGGGLYASTQQSITGGGNVFSYPTIVLTNTGSPNITAVTLNQQTDALQITVTQTLHTNDYLTITNDPFLANGLTVTYNGGNPLDFSGGFNVMEPGPTLWQIVATAGSQPSMSASWVWQSRWAS